MKTFQTWTTERIARLLALGLLGLACFQIVLPFLGALAWAGVIAITVWPVFVALSARLGQRPVWAAGLCSLGLLVVLGLPFAMLTATLSQAIPQLAKALTALAVTIEPTLPRKWWGCR